MKIIRPGIPPKEKPAITIAMQAKQIDLLLDRCAELRVDCDKLQSQSEIKDGLLQEQREQYTDLSDAYSRLSGWQDCAREMLGTRLDTTAPGS